MMSSSPTSLLPLQCTEQNADVRADQQLWNSYISIDTAEIALVPNTLSSAKAQSQLAPTGKFLALAMGNL